MSELVVDSGIRTKRDLLGILPPEVAERIDPYELGDKGFAAALRVLATVKDERWRAEVFSCGIRFTALAETFGPDGGSVGVRVAAAASLYGAQSFHQVDLRRCALTLDDENFLAFVDGLRIAREGLAS